MAAPLPAFFGAGNGGLRMLDLTNNPDVGVAGLQSIASALAPDEALHAHHPHEERKDASSEAVEAPGLRLLVAQFTASHGDKRQLSPSLRAELDAVAHRLARMHCHVLT